ncbi:hypothetical protein SPACI_024910 [Sporomusa acidovorans DSM 3132]|uniref:FAD dependent oxidoreductase domain-containing protein n=2 Tax=Sporomusa TaxID=2375 RepID=A0ABZ3J230_SPOA4|nr:FAD-dependent oxidoreductase [Sporomusa acidovorans]OZC19936.1 putative thiazole biosynthetic enzyme [Sporomusa acidovorans DSM 3132]SDD49470.1 FAD dependent oxidoreductase [Sporomusa acidovorans]
MHDVCVIGAGVVGMNIARQLAKYNVKVCVLEKNRFADTGFQRRRNSYFDCTAKS